MLVLLGHLSGTQGVPKLDFHIGDYAHFGVVIFFVISGFLITTLLLAEHARNESVSLKLFYARRSIRIFPASYAYLAIMFVLSFDRNHSSARSGLLVRRNLHSELPAKCRLGNWSSLVTLC